VIVCIAYTTALATTRALQRALANYSVTLLRNVSCDDAMHKMRHHYIGAEQYVFVSGVSCYHCSKHRHHCSKHRHNCCHTDSNRHTLGCFKESISAIIKCTPNCAKPEAELLLAVIKLSSESVVSTLHRALVNVSADAHHLHGLLQYCCIQRRGLVQCWHRHRHWRKSIQSTLQLKQHYVHCLWNAVHVRAPA
jgi:hypothetical protein